MIDVCRNDGSAARDLIANELRRDVFGNTGAERLPPVLETQARAVVSRCVISLVSAEVLADCDELHFGCDDALPRVVQLRHGPATGSLPRLAAQARE